MSEQVSNYINIPSSRISESSLRMSTVHKRFRSMLPEKFLRNKTKESNCILRNFLLETCYNMNGLKSSSSCLKMKVKIA
jgi:hypothetical protein